jgi:hypothetical protein
MIGHILSINLNEILGNYIIASCRARLSRLIKLTLIPDEQLDDPVMDPL